MTDPQRTGEGGEPQPLAFLLPYAQRLIQVPDNANALSNFIVRLAGVTDIPALHDFAQMHTPQPEVSVPAYRRLIELEPDNPLWPAELGFIYFLVGEDELAAECCEAAQRLNPDLITALELQAALSQDAAEKKQIYERIVNLDPKNRVAFDHLLMLQSGR